MLICLTKDIIKHLVQKVVHLLFLLFSVSKASQIPHPACHTHAPGVPCIIMQCFSETLSLKELLILWRWRGKFSCLPDQMRNPLSRRKKKIIFLRFKSFDSFSNQSFSLTSASKMLLLQKNISTCQGLSFLPLSCTQLRLLLQLFHCLQKAEPFSDTSFPVENCHLLAALRH